MCTKWPVLSVFELLMYLLLVHNIDRILLHVISVQSFYLFKLYVMCTSFCVQWW